MAAVPSIHLSHAPRKIVRDAPGSLPIADGARASHSPHSKGKESRIVDMTRTILGERRVVAAAAADPMSEMLPTNPVTRVGSNAVDHLDSVPV